MQNSFMQYKGTTSCTVVETVQTTSVMDNVEQLIKMHILDT